MLRPAERRGRGYSHAVFTFLAYDPATKSFGYLKSLHKPNEYPQSAYLLAGKDGELYFFGQDIDNPKTGVLEREYHGKAMAFQTRPFCKKAKSK